MKKRMLLLLGGAMIACLLQAQDIREGEPALIYYSPKTVVVVDFTYSMEKEEPGIYARYAEAMIGADNAVTEARTVYTIEDIHIGTSTIPDYSRPHKVSTEGGIPLLLNINEKGLLVGYNAPSCIEKNKQKQSAAKKQEDIKFKKTKNTVIPYPEEALKAVNEQAQAFEVAKQIFHLRETRMYLLSGEIEHAPADGKAMDLVLTELNRQEKALTELFVGKRSKEILHKRMDYREIEVDRQNETTRCQAKKYVYPLFFSTENGFTNAENVDADSILTCVQLQIPPYHKTISKKDKKKKYDVSEIVYNLPGYCDVNVVYKGQTLSERTIPLAQSGMDVPLPKELFSGSELPSIVFSEKTGNIISISK